MNRAEQRIRDFWLRHNKPILYVGFSAGKDSATTLAAALNAVGPENVVAWYWHIPGQTHRDNLHAARQTARRLGLGWQTHVIKEPNMTITIEPAPATIHHVIIGNQPYWKLLHKHGPPAPPPRPRWCCRLYKETPLTWTKPWRDGYRYVLSGVKRADSPARRRRWQTCERRFRNRHGPAPEDIALAPLCDYTDHEVWELLEHYNLRDTIQPQYDKWRRSPNCTLCPLASKKQLQQAAQQLPPQLLQKYYDALQPWNTQLAKRMKKIIEDYL